MVDAKRMVADFVEGAANNTFGRPITIQLAKEAGIQDALRKFVNDPHKTELAGLGMMAVPVAHDIISDEDKESHAVRKAKQIAELVGLGVLGHSTLKEMH